MMDYAAQWVEEHERVLEILRKTDLEEKLKWGIPIFTYNEKNVAAGHGFKDHYAVWFHDGVFLDDPYGRLVTATEGKTKALRQLRFTKEEGIDENLILFYLHQAIKNAKEGKTWKPERAKADTMEIPALLQQALDENSQLKDNFEALTPFRKKEYIEYIAEAKQEKTKLARLEKTKPLLLQKRGLNDIYR